MAILVSAATGNLTAAATWKVVHAATFTTLRATQETAAQQVATGTSASPNFTIAAGITVDAILLKHNNTNLADSQTITVQLYNATTATVVASVTRGPGSFPLVTQTPNWFQFEFPSVIMATATNYQIRIVATGTANQNQFFRKSATASDWTFGLRTTTTAAPASGDILLIAGKYAATGNRTDFTVTNDNTSTALLLGNGVANTSGIEVSYGSKLVNALTASTNYSLRVSGDFAFNGGSIFECGTSTGTQLPQTSTATFEIYQPVAQQFSWFIRSTVNAFVSIQAVEAQTGKRLQASNLTAAILATNTTLTIADSGTTNWKSGDEIVVGSTERNYQQVEYRTMSANESAGTVTVSAGFTYAHSRYHDSWSKVNVPVANLTKNIIFKGTSTTLRAGNMTFGGFTDVYLSGVLFQNWGQLGIDQAQGTDSSGVTGVVPHQTMKDVVIKDYSTGVTTITRNPKNLTVDKLTAARALAVGSFGFRIANITEGTLVEAGFNVEIEYLYSFGGTGTTDGRLFLSPNRSNAANNWYLSAFGPTSGGVGIYINGLNGTGLANTIAPFEINGSNAVQRAGLDWTIDLFLTIVASQNWASNLVCVVDGYQPDYWWWAIRSIKNDGNGISFKSVSTYPITHNTNGDPAYFSISEQNSLAQVAFANTANAFVTSINNFYVGASSANPGTAFFQIRYVELYNVIIADAVGASFPTSGLFIFSSTDGDAIGSATKMYFDFSQVTSSTITATKTLFVGINTQFTSESAFTVKDNSGNLYTYTRDAVLYPDSVNYYQTAPSTVLDTTGQTPYPSFVPLIYSPIKRFVAPKTKLAKVSVWVYVTTTAAGTITTTLDAFAIDTGEDTSRRKASTTTLGAWTRLTVSMYVDPTNDRFYGARVFTSSIDTIVKISDWSIELV